MTAFDTAWDLMKMPIVAGSLKPVGDGKWQGLFEEDTKYDAVNDEYIDNDPIPMPITANMRSGGFKAQIHGNDGELRSEFSGHRRGDYGDEKGIAYSVNTKEPHRRKGYARAMYDAIAYLLSQEDINLYPSHQQTSEGWRFWDDLEYMGFGKPYDEEGIPIWPLGRYDDKGGA
tara:strand:- start:2281 stop:2799 length:519 start_codon:yes stop_codon:yes gene_type:complete